MKLLVLTPGVFPDTYSGLGKLVYYISRQLKRSGNDVVIITRRFRSKYALYDTLPGNIPCYRVPHPDRNGPFHPIWPIVTTFRSRSWQKKVKRVHKDFDAILTINPWWILFADPRKIWPHSKLIYHLPYDPYTEIVSNRGNTWKTRTFGRFYDFITKICMRRADKIYVCSQHTKEIVLKMLGASYENRLMVVPCAVDFDVYSAASPEEKKTLKRELNIPLDMPVFITVRGLKHRTGVDKLVNVAYKLKENNNSFFLILIGKGPEKNHIERQIKSFGLENHVRLVSNLSEDDLVKYYRASTAFILPSQAAEGFGLATIEALACGLAVFGTNIGATPEILNLYQPNWIINGCGEKEIYEKMADFCSNPEQFAMPPQKIREITKEHFSWPAVAAKFLKEINSV